MSSGGDKPRIVHFCNAGSCDVFRQYLDDIAPSLDLNSLEHSTKTPGYIVSGHVVEKFPAVNHSSGFYHCVFVVQPEGFPEQLRIIVKTRTPKDLKQIDRNSFLAVFNPKYSVGSNGRKSFSLGPEQIVLWFSRAPLKVSRKRLATSPVRCSDSAPKNLKLSPLKSHGGLSGAPCFGDGNDTEQMPPPPSRIVVARNRVQSHRLDHDEEISARSSRACGHSVYSHSKHSRCANSTCADHHHCALVQQSSCCQVAQHSSCSRQCCSHNRPSRCHGCHPSRTCHHAPLPPCSIQAHYESCPLGCHSKYCNDSREVDHHRCCSKLHFSEAPPRACGENTSRSHHPVPARMTEEQLESPINLRPTSRNKADWFVRNWVEQSTLENKRAACVVAPNHNLVEPLDTQGTFGDSFRVDWDDNDNWSSVSEQINNANRVRKAPAVLDPVKSGPVKTQKRNDKREARGHQGPSLQDFPNAELTSTSQPKSTGTGDEITARRTSANQENVTIEKNPDSEPLVKYIERRSERSCGQESSRNSPTCAKNSQVLVPQAAAHPKCKINLATKAQRKNYQRAHNTHVQAYDCPELQAHCSKDVINPPEPPQEKCQPTLHPPRAGSALESDSDSSVNTSLMFFGKTQSLLLGGSITANPETQITRDQDLNKAIQLDSSSDGDDIGMEVEQEEQSEQQECQESPEIPSNSQLTCLDTLEPPPPTVSCQIPKIGIPTERKKTLRQLFNPANSSWYFDPRNPTESTLCKKVANKPAEECSEAMDTRQDTGVAKFIVGVTTTDLGISPTPDGKLSNAVDRNGEQMVGSINQETDEEIIPPSDGEMAIQSGVIPPSDAEIPSENKSELSRCDASETIHQIEAFLQEWDSDPCPNNLGPRTAPKSTTRLLSNLLSENGSPSKVSFNENASKTLSAFTSLHSAPINASNVVRTTRNQDITSSDETANHTVQPSKQESTINKKADPIAAVASSLKVVSDSGSEVPSSQPSHENRLCESLNVENECGNDDINISNTHTICSPAVDDPVRTNCNSLVLCKPDTCGTKEKTVSEDAGSQSSVSLEPEQSYVSPNHDQGDNEDVDNDDTLENEQGRGDFDENERRLKDPTRSNSLIPANASNNESVAPDKPPNPTPEPPTSQIVSDLDLHITDSGSPESLEAAKPPSNVTDDVPKKPDETNRRSPDSTTEHLSEEHLLSLEPPCSPVSTVFYDAQDDDEFANEDAQTPSQDHQVEIAKASSSSAEDADVSRRLSISGQVFGVSVVIVDMKPSISLKNRMDIIKGICLSGCQSTFNYQTSTRGKTMIRPCLKCSIRRHHVCPTCKKTGIKRPLCLQFQFEIHALIGSRKCLRLQVEHEEAMKFLDTDVRKYLKQGSAALQIVQALQNLCGPPEQRKRRLQGHVFIRTEDRDCKVVPFLTNTKLSDLRLSKSII